MTMIIKYQDFLSKKDRQKNININDKLLENVQQAKDFLKKLEIQRRKDLGLETKLSEEEVKELEKHPYFLKIKSMVEKTPGVTYLFTKAFFKDYKDQWEGSEYRMEEVFQDLKRTYDQLVARKELWGNLPMTFDKYASIDATHKDTRGSLERLTDDWRDVIDGLKAKQFFLNRLLPFQKKWFKDAPESIVKRVNAIGSAFASFGEDENGNIDKNQNKILNDDFFIKIRNGERKEYIARFQTLGELLKGAEDYINNSNNNNYKFIRDRIEEANRRCGLLNGVDIIWEERGLMVCEVKSFAANQIVNRQTSHCIKDSLSQWDSYVKLESFKRQYYLYNFNLPTSDSKSIIGVTIDSNGTPTHCHAKRDEGFLSELYPYMDKNKIPREVLEPYTPEEQRKISLRLNANKKMRLENADLDIISTAIEEGGDVNVDNGTPLKNAIKNGNVSVVRKLIDAGANVQLRSDLLEKLNQNAKIEDNKAILSLLIGNGLEINAASYRHIHTQLKTSAGSIYEIVKIMLEAGLDPDQMNGRLLRDGIVRKDVKWVKELSNFNLNFAARNYMVLLVLLQQGEGNNINQGHFETKLIDVVFSKFRENRDKILQNNPQGIEHRRSILLNTIFDVSYVVTEGDDVTKANRIGILLDKFVEYGSRPDYEFLIQESDNIIREEGLKSSSDKYKYIKAVIKEISKRIK